MWNNQLSTVNSKKLIGYVQLQGINYIIPDAYWYGVPNSKDIHPSKIKVVNGKLMCNHPPAGLTSL
jgi:hypothetical protein